MIQGAKIRNLGAAIWRAISNINFCLPRCESEHCYHIYQKLLNSTYTHSNVTIKNVSWPHFSWPTLFMPWWQQ